ncbi:hypothetical protein [Amycolatopsis saalfeldensis]|uniref:Uncharacterized protein n=1 Tax=Amycolatopsis saalfeldensis TaxID=394193 RepID=A0A1H8YGN4_9PSEU|nr:hypothetical protein [Amycolatopsis saalfeldensis]SEP50608.1 hypothetical protein SAMN04489732_114215 [Amycolatopsis saalfeldensis]
MAASESVPPSCGFVPFDPLPVRPGLYYRFHHPAVPLDVEHARSVPMHDGDLPEQDGWSCFADPHSLWCYLHALDWLSAPEEVDFHERHVVAFGGSQIGTGIDHEPLVMPEGDPELRLSWHEFEQRLSVTERPSDTWAPC